MVVSKKNTPKYTPKYTVKIFSLFLPNFFQLHKFGISSGTLKKLAQVVIPIMLENFPKIVIYVGFS